MQITKNQAACATVALLAATATGNMIAAMTTASKMASLAYGVLGIIYSGASIAAISAWLDRSSRSASTYFDAFRSHLEYAVDRMVHLLNQAFS